MRRRMAGGRRTGVGVARLGLVHPHPPLRGTFSRREKGLRILAPTRRGWPGEGGPAGCHGTRLDAPAKHDISPQTPSPRVGFQHVRGPILAVEFPFVSSSSGV